MDAAAVPASSVAPTLVSASSSSAAAVSASSAAAGLPPPTPATQGSSTMSRVEIAFQEYQDRREGLIKALSNGLETLIEEGKKIDKHTPYEERKCLWGLKNKGWELLKHPIYPTFGEPPHPQPLAEFDEAVTTLTEWIGLVSDYSDAWLAGVLAYNSLSFSQQERMELMARMDELPCLKDVVVVPHIPEPKLV